MGASVVQRQNSRTEVSIEWFSADTWRPSVRLEVSLCAPFVSRTCPDLCSPTSLINFLERWRFKQMVDNMSGAHFPGLQRYYANYSSSPNSRSSPSFFSSVSRIMAIRMNPLPFIVRRRDCVKSEAHTSHFLRNTIVIFSMILSVSPSKLLIVFPPDVWRQLLGPSLYDRRSATVQSPSSSNFYSLTSWWPSSLIFILQDRSKWGLSCYSLPFFISPSLLVSIAVIPC